MDRTPSEIWIKIFAHACTDSGETGRQLSLVSKFTRAASAPVKLQSIAAYGHRQILAFHQLLSRTPPHLRHIRYLFLSATLPRHVEPEGRLGLAEQRQLINACQAILVLVAGCVEILYLDMPWSPEHWPNISFPKLVELASHGSPMNPIHYLKPIPVPCLQLRRWHLLGYPWILGGGGFFAIIGSTAPAITHIRFSGLQQEIQFVEDIQARPLPETIQHLYVELASRPPARYGELAELWYLDLVRDLERLNLADSRLVLLPICNTNKPIKIFTAREWEERINGGDGCWSSRERILAGSNVSVSGEPQRGTPHCIRK